MAPNPTQKFNSKEKDHGTFYPSAARQSHASMIPDSIISTINHLLATRIYHEAIEITQAELTEAVIARGYTEEEFLDRGWINFEELYREHGWFVQYARAEGVGSWTFKPRPGE